MYEMRSKDHGIRRRCELSRLFMLPFADDLLLFCHADTHSVGVLKEGLSEFATLSGLHANPLKSDVFISKKAVPHATAISTAIGYHLGTLPVRYLGVPLTTSRLTINDCTPLLEKVDRRIGSWLNRTLSYAGRVQLIKSVLSSLHVYWAGVFPLPKGVIRELEGRFRRFLWAGTTAKVAWDDLCLPRREGGLGIRSLAVDNQAMLMKHLWRLAKRDTSSSWVQWIIQTRLATKSLWTFNPSATSSWGWKKILKFRPLMLTLLRFHIGDGSSLLLWQDPWMEAKPLINSFQRGPIALGLPIDSRLSSVISANGWNWPGCRNREYLQFYLQVNQNLPSVHPSERDSIVWLGAANGRFTVSSARDNIRIHQNPPPWVQLFGGCLSVPRKDFILWLALRDKLATRDKTWVALQAQSNLCILCDANCIENTDHLFFQCTYTNDCLHILKDKISLRWPKPNTNWKEDVTWAARTWRGKHLHNMINRHLLAALVYHIWMERNRRWRENAQSTPDRIAENVIAIIRLRLETLSPKYTLQISALRRMWHIAW